MAFRFPLAAVLKYRESMEQREYLALERIQMEIARMQAQIAQAAAARSAAAASSLEQLSRGLAAIHLQEAREYESALERSQTLFEEKLKELRVSLRQRLRTYQIARQKREVLDELRSRQKNAYERDQARLQQNAVDDLTLARRKRRG
jgi:flagellar export protein FliJ